MIDAHFWNERRVLLTGHTGFKGSWLSLWLHRLGAEVTGFAMGPPTDPSLFELARVGDALDDLRGDVRDRHAVQGAVARADPEVVLHLAAQPLVGRGLRAPAETFETNVMGTVHLLEAIRNHPGDVRSVVVVTSDKCYRNRSLERGYTEDDPLGGDDPYAGSKAAQEHVVEGYRTAGLTDLGVHAATARAGNVIGGGDWADDRLVPDFMRASMAGERLAVRLPQAVRPWQHVLNPLSGYLRLAEVLWDSEQWARAWNFGPPPEAARSVGWLIDALHARDGSVAGTAVDGHGHAACEATTLRLDAMRAQERIGWRIAWDLETALDATADWYAAHRRGEDMRAVTLDQIAAYEATLAVAA
jgi:CDP-glucose 4,6-dehydratase